MSVIAAYLIAFDGYEDEAIASVNRHLYEIDTARHQQFRQINMDGAGGSKYYTADVWAAAFNHLTPTDVDNAIAVAPWRFPEGAVVVLSAPDYDIASHARTVAQMQAVTINRQEQ